MPPTATHEPAPPTTGAAPPTPDDWVPADRRWAGFDKRTVGPALFVLGFALLLNLVLPGIDGAVDVDDPVTAGDVLVLTGGTSLVPVEGWDVVKGVREGDEPAGGPPGEAEVSDGAVSVVITTAPFDGDARALVDQITETTDALNDDADVHVTGDAVAVSTASGADGLLVHYHSTSTEGVLAAFVRDGTGIRVVATGPPGLSDGEVRDIAATIDSIELGGKTS